MDNMKAIYKILKGLEKSMGDEDFTPRQISAEALKIPFGRWEQLMIMLQDEGYIKGLALSQDLSQRFRHIAGPIKPEITLRGLEYLADNGYMAKAKEALQMIGEII